MPTHSSELALLLFVTLLVPLNFLLPKLNVGFRQTEVFAILMTMSETAVHKDDRTVFTQHQIRMTGQTWMVEPIAEAPAEKEFPHQYFGFGVLSTYCSHVAMALFFSQSIHLFHEMRC